MPGSKALMIHLIMSTHIASSGLIRFKPPFSHSWQHYNQLTLTLARCVVPAAKYEMSRLLVFFIPMLVPPHMERKKKSVERRTLFTTTALPVGLIFLFTQYCNFLEILLYREEFTSSVVRERPNGAPSSLPTSPSHAHLIPKPLVHFGLHTKFLHFQ